MTWRSGGSVLVLLLGWATTAGAQVDSASIIRWKEFGGWMEGRVVEPPTRDRPLRVRIVSGPRGSDRTAAPGELVDVAWSSAELSRRIRQGRRNRSTLVGAGVGALVGIAIGVASGDDPPGFLALTAKDKAAVGVILLAPIGALVGALVGPGAKWQSVGPPTVAVGTGRGPLELFVAGGRMGFTLSF